MEKILDRLPAQVAERIHPDWRRNERGYWAHRESLRKDYEGQWVGFADGMVVSAGDSPVKVLHEAQRTGRHPYITCVGREDTLQKMRLSRFTYDQEYPGEPLPRASVDFRCALDGPSIRYDDTIPDTGADASALPWADCEAIGLNLEDASPGLMGGVGGSTSATLVWASYACIDGVEYPCWPQADFVGQKRIPGRDVLNQLDVLFQRPAREVVFDP